jgi:isopenicillin N synthase-like dioxygenase
MEVSRVDCSAPNAPARFAASLRTSGFALLVQHPLSAELLEAMVTEWQAFFATAAKHRYRNTGRGQAGYFPPPEAARGRGLDHKEFFHVRPGELYPSEVSPAALEHFDRASALAVTLLGWIEASTPPAVTAGFSMPLPQMADGSQGTVLRIQQYLPLADPQVPGAVRALAHEDINLLTLLPLPTEPGLQIADRHGTWHHLVGPPGSLVVNTGQMLQAASQGHYPATNHRVVVASPQGARRSRVSLPLFVHAGGDVVMAGGETAAAFLRRQLQALQARGWQANPGQLSG